MDWISRLRDVFRPRSPAKVPSAAYTASNPVYAKSCTEPSKTHVCIFPLYVLSHLKDSLVSFIYEASFALYFNLLLVSVRFFSPWYDLTRRRILCRLLFERVNLTYRPPFPFVSLMKLAPLIEVFLFLPVNAIEVLIGHQPFLRLTRGVPPSPDMSVCFTLHIHCHATFVLLYYYYTKKFFLL